jgi:hypothetical protein
MKCKNCGARVYSGDSYCPYCGTEIYYQNKSSSGGHKPLQDKYLRGEYVETSKQPEYYEEEYYDEEVYEEEVYEEDKGRSVWSVIILLLIIALVIGLVIGVMVFSSTQSVPPVHINS